MVEAAGTRIELKEYKSGVKPTWCPGCGDYGVLAAMYKALADLQLKPEETVVVSGIGCSSRFPYFLSTYGVHGIHGRGLPIAQAVKLANPKLTVFSVGGDGDLFSIGAGHMPHAASRNVDITCILMDNAIYGLTKGQSSPTSPRGHKTKATPYGSIIEPMNPVMLALAYGATFVARAYSAKPKQLTELIKQAVLHRGFAFVAVESPCTEFNNTFDLIDSLVAEIPAEHNTADPVAAIQLAMARDKKYLGLFYQGERPVYESEAAHLVDERVEFDAEAYLSRFE